MFQSTILAQLLRLLEFGNQFAVLRNARLAGLTVAIVAPTVSSFASMCMTMIHPRNGQLQNHDASAGCDGIHAGFVPFLTFGLGVSGGRPRKDIENYGGSPATGPKFDQLLFG